MSRSYHVTKRAAVRAFILDSDTDLTAEASDKAGIKRRERVQRSREALGLKRQPNRLDRGALSPFMSESTAQALSIIVSWTSWAGLRLDNSNVTVALR